MGRSTSTRTPRVRKPRPRAECRERREASYKRFNVLGFPEYNAIPDCPAPGTEDRVASVVPMIAREAMRVWRGLTPRQRARVDLDDLIQEGWTILLARDHNYDPVRHPRERGGYLGFASLTIRQAFRRVLGRTYPVQLPKNVADHCKGACSKPEVASAVRVATRGEATIQADRLATGNDPTFDAVEHREAARLAREAISRALPRVVSEEPVISVLRWSYGILDCMPRSNADQAAILETSPAMVNGIRTRAELAMKSALASPMAVR